MTCGQPGVAGHPGHRNRRGWGWEIGVMGTSPPLAVRLLCEPAWGPHADRRATRLISREAEGSPTGAYSQPTGSLTPRWLTLQSGYGRNTPDSGQSDQTLRTHVLGPNSAVRHSGLGIPESLGQLTGVPHQNCLTQEGRSDCRGVLTLWTSIHIRPRSR